MPQTKTPTKPPFAGPSRETPKPLPSVIGRTMSKVSRKLERRETLAPPRNILGRRG